MLRRQQTRQRAPATSVSVSSSRVFIINLKKLALVPSHVMLHFGPLIDTARGLVFPSPAWTEMIIHTTRSLLDLTQVSGLRLRQVTGLLALLPCSGPPLHVSSLFSVDSPERSLCHEGRLHFQADPLVISGDPVSSGILVTPGSCVPWRSCSTPSSHSCPNDGRIHFWMGSSLRPFDCKGCVVEQSVFSPYKLSLAGDGCVVHTWLCGAHVLVQMDSTTVMHYLHRAGGTRSRNLDWKVRDIFLWCLSLRITLSAVHISGQDNVEADRLSRFRIENPRRLERSTKWSLDRRVTNQFFDIWDLLTVDLFTTQLNNKVEALFSRLPDHLSLHGNSLQADWSKGLLYMYPPRAPPIPCSSQGDKGRGSGLAILPWWPRRGWFPLVLQLLVDLSVMLPELAGLLLDPNGTEHPNLGELRLTAWRLSGDLSAAEAF